MLECTAHCFRQLGLILMGPLENAQSTHQSVPTVRRGAWCYLLLLVTRSWSRAPSPSMSRLPSGRRQQVQQWDPWVLVVPSCE